MGQIWLYVIIGTLVWLGLPIAFALGARWGYGNGYRHGHEVGFLLRALYETRRGDIARPRKKAGNGSPA